MRGFRKGAHHSPTFTHRKGTIIGLRWSPFQFIERMDLFTLPPLRTLHYILKYNPAYSRIMPKKPFKTVCPPCFEPAVLAGLSWFVERWKNSFQKTGMFFGASGSRNITKQIMLYTQPIPTPS